jgi:hypothetical protein
MYFNAYYRKFNQPKDFIKSAMGTLRYISRKGELTVWGDKIYSLEEAEEIIRTRAEGWPRRFWRVQLSPDIVEENEGKSLDIWELTRKTFEYIKAIDPDYEFVVAEHRDTNIPHTQGLLFFKGKLYKDDLDKIRNLAHGYALEQQAIQKQAREFIKSVQMYPGIRQSVQISIDTPGRKAIKPRQLTVSCPNGILHKVNKWKDKNYCLNCERVIEQSMGLEL